MIEAGRGRWTTTALPLLVLGAACATKPPPDFAPEPALVERITEIRMHTGGVRVCPGHPVRASYDAVLDDGSVVPFSTQYDEKNPPQLHVVFLRRTSQEAVARTDGGWDTDPEPLTSAVTGFRLSAFMLAKPSLNVHRVVEPEYSCLRNVFSFRGRRGKRAQGGHAGPDITVRLDILSSPFYDRLLVAGLEVGEAPSVYIVADADDVPPADWLRVESKGAGGGRGIDGSDGAEGTKGADGCPAGAGGAGGAGGNGGPGGPGGPGGRVTIIVPEEQPLLAGLVDAHGAGGEGGKGGRAGKGGPGGEGGKGVAGNQRCQSGAAGPSGADGAAGSDGRDGSPAPRAQLIALPGHDVFGDRVPEALRALIEYGRGRRR